MPCHVWTRSIVQLERNINDGSVRLGHEKYLNRIVDSRKEKRIISCLVRFIVRQQRVASQDSICFCFHEVARGQARWGMAEQTMCAQLQLAAETGCTYQRTKFREGPSAANHRGTRSRPCTVTSPSFCNASCSRGRSFEGLRREEVLISEAGKRRLALHRVRAPFEGAVCKVRAMWICENRLQHIE